MVCSPVDCTPSISSASSASELLDVDSVGVCMITVDMVLFARGASESNAGSMHMPSGMGFLTCMGVKGTNGQCVEPLTQILQPLSKSYPILIR